jgi:hypothetical protein
MAPSSLENLRIRRGRSAREGPKQVPVHCPAALESTLVDGVSGFHITTLYHPIIRILPSEEVRRTHLL